MSINSRVHFQNMEGSPALEAAVQKQLKKLQRFYDHVISCDVSVEAPHHHKHKGGVYKVIIKLAVPGETLVVSHPHGDNESHSDCYVAIHDAFHSARRRLQDYARIQRHQVKHHEVARRHEPAANEVAGPDSTIDKSSDQ
ncbi:MAG: HPF/RaiA family ribosome-associated protein [Woeseia sp.]